MTSPHDKVLDMERAPHRATRAVVRKHGIPTARMLYSAFTEYNRKHFKRKLKPAMVLITDCGRAQGDYCEQDPHGLKSVIRVAPRSVMRGERYALDVLLHEMIHAWCAEVEHDKEAGYRGHGPVFAAMCNVIGEQLGLAPVGVLKRDGLPPCNYWPMNVRPEGYYPEAWKEPKRKSKDDAESGDSSADENAEPPESMPVPTVEAMMGAGAAADALSDYFTGFDEGEQQSIRALIGHLRQLEAFVGKGKPKRRRTLAEAAE